MKPNKKTIKFKISGFSLPKSGNKDTDNQDAFSISKDQLTFSIADGASLSPKSGLWSRVLTKHFVEDKFDFKHCSVQTISQWLEIPRKEWKENLNLDQLPDMLKMKIKKTKGSVCTFIGCNFVNNQKKNRMNVMYVGDSTAFLIRNNKIKKNFPVENSNQFSSFTQFIGSTQEYGGEEILKIETLNTDGIDSIIIATDELAKWIIHQKENDRKEWLELLNMDKEKYVEFIKKLRDTKQVEEDDMTCVISQRISHEKNSKIQLQISEFT